MDQVLFREDAERTQRGSRHRKIRVWLTSFYPHKTGEYTQGRMIYINEAYPPGRGSSGGRYTAGVRIYTGGGITGRDYLQKGVTGRVHPETDIGGVSFEQAYKRKRDIP